MLIRGIRAKNFMKFNNLNIENIPSQGLLGIEGQNEGGKSTIGELIQFALFGKTLSSASSSLEGLINWDQDECSVELDFDIATGAEQGSYRVFRQIDKYGTNYSRILDLTTGKEIAAGLLQVSESISRLVRFDFDDYVRSFYLAEKETPRSPDEMRSFLDRMVGVDTLITVSNTVQKQIEKLETDFGKLQSEIKRNKAQVEKYVPNVAKIPEVEKVRDAHIERIESLKQDQQRLEKEGMELDEALKMREAQRDRLRTLGDKPAARFKQGLAQVMESYPKSELPGSLKSSKKDVESIRAKLDRLQLVAEHIDGVQKAVVEADREIKERVEGSSSGSYSQLEKSIEGQIIHANGRRKNQALIANFFLLLGLAGLIVFLGQQQGWFDLSEKLQLSHNAIRGIFGGVGAVGILLSIVFVLKAGFHKGAVRSSEAEKAALVDRKQSEESCRKKLDEVDRESVKVTELASVVTACGVESVVQKAGDLEKDLLAAAGSDGLAQHCQKMADVENKIVQRVRSHSKNVRRDCEVAKEAFTKECTKRDRAETEIREYQKQEGRKLGLEEQNAEIQKRADEFRSEIETRQLLLGLLKETVESVRHRTGPSLGKTMRKLLPSLTGGRYKDLKITSEFRLQVFTSDKSDFLAPHELSGGTFEGLSLGFRMAFSQAFISAVVHGPQFLFLDEPFKAMDADRVHRTLSALVKLSPELKQVFVIIPGIKEGDRQLFDEIFQVTVGKSEFDTQGTTATGSSHDSVRTAKSSESQKKLASPRSLDPQSPEALEIADPLQGMAAHEDPRQEPLLDSEYATGLFSDRFADEVNPLGHTPNSEDEDASTEA